MFFRSVVFGRSPASILVCFWLHLGGLGPPSWGHVGPSGVSIGPQIGFGVSFGRSWRLELILNLEIEQILERWRQKMPSWGHSSSILEAPGRDFGGVGRPRGVFLGGLLT